MPQVTVKDCAHIDPRLRLAGRLLKLHHERLGWRLIQLWSLATARNSPLIAEAIVGAALGKSEADVAHALITAELAESVDGCLDLSPMQTMFGDCKWLHNKKGTAPAGGQVRAATAERAPDGTFAALRDRILDRLQERSYKRADLVESLKARKAYVLSTVRELLADGVIAEDGGILSLAPAGSRFPVPGTEPREPGREPGTESREPIREPGTGTAPEPVPGSGFREPASALALALALAPAPALACESDARTRAREPGTGNREPAIASARPDRYSVLFEQWDAIGRDKCGGAWRSPGELAGRHRIREALNHPELAGRTDDDIRHGLAMLRAECAERARLGQSDAWCWYRKAWQPRVLSAACDIPDEATARNRASPRTGQSTQPPTSWLDEIDADIAAKEQADAES